MIKVVISDQDVLGFCVRTACIQLQPYACLLPHTLNAP